jgi:PTS system galactitol-specific IIA component
MSLDAALRPPANLDAERNDASALRDLIRADLMLVGITASAKEEVVRQLSSLLETQGYVKPSFCEAVLEREKHFPTGLPTAGIQVALPHTDVEHCLRPAIAVAVLKHSVPFIEMATLDKPVEAEIVFLLSITNPKAQVEWLQCLVTLFQQPGFLRSLKDTSSAAACSDLLRDGLGKEANRQS